MPKEIETLPPGVPVPTDPKTGNPYRVLGPFIYKRLTAEAKEMYVWDIPSQRYLYIGPTDKFIEGEKQK